MQRLRFFLSLSILTTLLLGCAPRTAIQPVEVQALENSTATAEPKTTTPTESVRTEVLPAEPPANCPITQPPEVAFVPPEPYPSVPPERYVNEFWYGTPELWTMLRSSGTWNALPHNKYGYTQKIFWWSQDFDVKENPYPAFTLIIERLDVESSPMVVAEEATNASADFGTAMLTGVDLPSLGCWKITGQYKEATLSFVVWVAP